MNTIVSAASSSTRALVRLIWKSRWLPVCTVLITASLIPSHASQGGAQSESRPATPEGSGQKDSQDVSIRLATMRFVENWYDDGVTPLVHGERVNATRTFVPEGTEVQIKGNSGSGSNLVLLLYTDESGDTRAKITGEWYADRPLPHVKKGRIDRFSGTVYLSTSDVKTNPLHVKFALCGDTDTGTRRVMMGALRFMQ